MKPKPIGLLEATLVDRIRRVQLRPTVATEHFKDASFIGLFWPYAAGVQNDLTGMVYARDVHAASTATANRIVVAHYVGKETETSPSSHIIDLYRYVLATEFEVNHVYLLHELEAWALAEYTPYLNLFTIGEHEVDIDLGNQTFFNTELIKTLEAWSVQAGLDLNMSYSDIMATRLGGE